MDDLLREFLVETFENLDAVDQELIGFERNPGNRGALDRVFRLVHTIKGTCGFLGLSRLEALSHAAETMLDRFRDGEVGVTPKAVSLTLSAIDRIKLVLLGLEHAGEEPPGDDSDLISALEAVSEDAPNPDLILDVGLVARQHSIEPVMPGLDLGSDLLLQESEVASQSIRVDVDLLERMMTFVSELVLTRNQLMQMLRSAPNSEFKLPLQRLSNITSDLQDGVMKTRMQPIQIAWAKLPRVLRDLSLELGKSATIEMTGADTELDRQVLDLIRAPLVHMVRNSVDHGLETPGERLAAGKNETGRIKLDAYHEGGHVVIEISDDGRGLNADRIAARALREGLTSEAEIARMSVQQIQQFIFRPGFSTAEKLTSISGRGVGMDVVHKNIEEIGGTIDLESVPGKGTRFTIKIPLTLTIISTLIVQSGGQRFAIPQIAITELVRAEPGKRHTVELIHDSPVLRLRSQLLPLVRLDEILGMARFEAAALCEQEAFIVVTQVGARSFGIVVDRVLDTEEIVVKPVASILRDVTEFCGNTILGDGGVVMIVDPRGIAARLAENSERETKAEQTSTDATPEAEHGIPLLIFRAGGLEQKAVPLALVTRLEEIEAGRMELCDGRHVVQYRGKLMPIIHIEQQSPLKSEGRQPVLVFTDGERAAGLAVDAIVDIVEEKLEIELTSKREGVLGLAKVNGRATEIIDAQYFISQIHDDWMIAQLEQAASALKGAAA